MDLKLRAAQQRLLQVLAAEARTFALAGGTALELYYLHHRFSADVDLFSPRYDLREIHHLVAAFRRRLRQTVRLESELRMGGRARVRFYTMAVKGSSRPLKIDFVEEVLFPKPAIRRVAGVRVYRVEQIYLQKIAAIAGTAPLVDAVGRTITQGRQEARDVFDLYMLSQRVRPLHRFLRRAPALWQKGLIHWYRTFSRQDLTLGLMDLEIYDPHFQAGAMIRYLDEEIRQFTRAVIEAP